MVVEPVEVLTIGHSTLPYESFLALLRRWSVNAIADVRTVPYSRHFQQYNSNTLRNQLKIDGISYSYLGEELGGRPRDRSNFRDGIADYVMMAGTTDFARGLRRIIEGSRRFRVAMMCSEHDPIDCHRCLLVGRALYEQGLSVKHILNTSAIAEQRDIEIRLMEWSGKSEIDLFDPPSVRLAAAYRERARKVAFSELEEMTQYSPKQEQLG